MASLINCSLTLAVPVAIIFCLFYVCQRMVWRRVFIEALPNVSHHRTRDTAPIIQHDNHDAEDILGMTWDQQKVECPPPSNEQACTTNTLEYPPDQQRA
ncbi:hypothetical protein DPMN_140401 [Dreissena polymorpha]|uniref:Uncharacterized protein n=1 Tax=Dreissena polymorpha TaxID=45954 RepID=A0A9D4GDG2_DREPO|nr:hypothetical protein DPMN_140401 [Dreissena polymorpha]